MIGKRSLESPGMLAEDLHKWASVTMQFKGYGKGKKCPTPEDLRILCKGQNQKIWQFVINNIMPTRTVKNIKGNLLLSLNQSKVHNSKVKGHIDDDDDDDDDGLKDLIRRKAAVEAELHETENSISLVGLDLERVKKEYLTNEHNYNNLEWKTMDASCTRRMTEEAGDRVQKDEEQMKELIEMVNDKTKTFQKILRNSSSTSLVMTSHSDANESANRMKESIDTKCFVDVRHCCSLLESFFHLSMETNKDEDKINNVHRSITTSMSDILMNYSAEEIVISLVRQVSQSNHQLMNLSSAHEASCKVSKTQLPESSLIESKTSRLLENFRHLLESSKINILERFVQKEKSTNTTLIDGQNEKIVAQLLLQKYSADTNCINVAESVFDLMKKVVTLREVHSTLEGHVMGLRKKVDEAEEEKVVLVEKYTRVANFIKIAEEKQNLSCFLAKENLNSRSRIISFQKEVIQFVRANFIGHDDKWVTLANQSDRLVTKEMNVFTKIGLQNFKLLLIDQSHASIHRSLSNQSWPFSSALLSIMETLKFPSYQSLDDLLPHIVSMETALLTSEFNKNSPKAITAENFHCVNEIVNELKDLSNKLKEVERSHVEHYAPIMSKRSSSVVQSLASCLRVKNVVVPNWWDQPGKTTVPWVKVDGLNFQQWLDQWKVAVSKLRQEALT